MSEAERRLWLGLRQALLIALGALETYLDLPRSAPRRRMRRQGFARKTLTPGPSPRTGEGGRKDSS